MNIKQKFLTLSIRHQISLFVIIGSTICLLLILALFSLYTNILLNIHIRKRKEYYYKKYQDIIESEVQFLNFLLYQHEQLLKGFNSQIYYFGLSQNDLYDTMINYDKNLIKNIKNIEEINSTEIENENIKYYLLSFSNDPFYESKAFNLLASTHSSIDNQLDILTNFRIPYLGEDFKIVNDYVFVRLSEESLYTMNKNRIIEIRENSNGNITNYYDNLITNYVKKYTHFMNEYKKGELNFFDIFFNSKFFLFENYVNETYLQEKYRNNVKNYLNDISCHFHFIDYLTEATFVTDNGNKNDVKFLEQNTIIPNYIDIIFSIIYNYSNINVIPVNHGNNKILSVNLCYAFLYKQMIFLNLTYEKNILVQEKLDEIYSKINKSELNIGDCILDKKYNFDTEQNAYDILNIKFDKFYSIKNSRELSMMKISNTILGNNLLCIKYTFPDYDSILNFKPDFFTLEQINLYSFKTLYEVKHYENNMISFFRNCQFFIILFLLYLWIIISFYLIFRLKKIFVEVTDPINNLINIINKLEVKEEDMLKYESDDTINELFKLCNELLVGKYKQKISHDSELDNQIFKKENKGNNLNDFNNLKLNRKLIEDMIENKNEYNIKGDEILTFKLNDHLDDKKGTELNKTNKNKKNDKADMRKTLLINRKIGKANENNDLINSIHNSIKKTKSINNVLNILNKKMSFDINLLNNSDNLILTEYKSDEEILEIEILLNYKHLYDIVDLSFNYDLKKDNKFICKNSKLLYKSNTHNHGKSHKIKYKRKISSSKISTGEKKDNNLNEKEIKEDLKMKKEEFDKSVVDAYNIRNVLFVWYEEAKYFKGIEFLQSNHTKELNNLFNFIGNENEKRDARLKSNLSINDIANTKQQKKIHNSKKQMSKY